MVKTPTYHIFNMFKNHQDSDLVYSFCENEKVGDKEIPAISQSVSVRDGEMTITVANCSLNEEYEICCDISGFEAASAAAEILDADVRAYNDFEDGEKVAPRAYDVKLEGSRVIVKMPACSVVSVILK